MVNTLPRLSIWEIACRSNGFDPRTTQIEGMPLSIRDAIKSLTRAAHYDENMPLLTYNGIENHRAINERTGKSYDQETIHSKISDSYVKELFDKDFLDTVYFENESFANWCLKQNIPLPEFWFPNGWHLDESIKVDSTKPEINFRPNQIDKLVCQAISRTLWDIYPVMTISAMCQHDAIQIYGNGKQYIGEHTLRGWISEVAPENIKGKKGRPKNPQP